MRFRLITIIALLLGFAIPITTLAGDELKDVKGLLDRSNRLSKQLSISKPHNKAAEQAAREAAKTYHSPEFQEKLRKEMARIKRELLPQARQEVCKEDESTGGILPATERIYVFISSSVPVATLRNYAADIDKVSDPNITMVMRGFVRGIDRLQPTLDFIHKILVRDLNCDPATTKCDTFGVAVNVDPLLYRRYKVEQVPTIVYVQGLNVTDPGLSEGMEKNAVIGDAYMLSGDVSLEYALEKIRQASHSPSLEAVINKLRKGFYR